jgi:hypothetical protein
MVMMTKTNKQATSASTALLALPTLSLSAPTSAGSEKFLS